MTLDIVPESFSLANSALIWENSDYEFIYMVCFRRAFTGEVCSARIFAVLKYLLKNPKSNLYNGGRKK